jgi:TonB family protein
MGMKKILVIDYDQASLQSLYKILTQEGFEAVLAGDGQAGWEKFQSEKPDLVLMEAMLSKIHGFELCDRITKDPARKVPVFIMTGVYKDRVYRTEALRTYGASEYFEKPLDMPKFMASIHAVLTVPDIKPEHEVKPENGKPTDGQGPVPVISPPSQAPHRVETSAEVKPVKKETPRTKPDPHLRPAGDGGLSLETVLNIRTAKDAPPKARPVPDGKLGKDDEIRLETLLNIKPEKEGRRRPEPAKPEPALPVPPKDLEEKPHGHIRKDHETEDIDNLLKTTLADFGLETEKKKPAKVIPAPAPPAPAPAPEKPKPAAPVAPAPQKPKPISSPPPTPPAAVAEKPAPPRPAPAVAQPQAKPKVVLQPVPPAPALAKTKVEPKPEPAATAHKSETREPVREQEQQKPADSRMFKDIYEVETKKSPAAFIAVGAGLVIVAAVGFFLLRPKRVSSPADQGLNSPVTQTQSSVPEKMPETVLPSLSEEKLKAMNGKPKAATQAIQNRQAEPLPTAEDAIVPPPLVDVSRPTAKGTAEKKAETKAPGTKPPEATAPDAKAGDTKAAEALTVIQTRDQPPAKVETAPPQGLTAAGTDPGTPPAAAPKAQPGDLVNLAAVDEQPKIMKSFDPIYPVHAQRFGKEGVVTVNALINEAGTVIEVGILKGLKDDMGLEKAATDAVKKWKFQPAKKDGVNVKVWKPIVITFKADQTKTS